MREQRGKGGKISVNLEFCNQLIIQEGWQNKKISDTQRLIEFMNHRASLRELKDVFQQEKQVQMETQGTEKTGMEKI